MASISNAQSESSHSGGGSSGDSDSEEQRFHAKENPSQRQHSSPTSASSSDAEQEDVSTRPAAEKPAATPSPKKNPKYSSDRSAVRNQSTPSEPNPINRSASKPKNGVAAKRAKDYAFAEEQPQAKKQLATKEKKPAEDDEGETEQNKKSASKPKKAAKEEVPASNPTTRKPRKRQLESLAPVPKVTPSAKDSQQKKMARVWTEDDENTIMHCYLVCAKEGLEYSKNKEQLLEKMNESLAHKASKPQLKEKVKRMKRRYEHIKNKMARGKIKEDAFAYKSQHEKELYQLWKQAWGEQHEEDEMEVHHTEAVGEDQTSAGDRGEEDEEEVESDGGADIDKEPKVPSTEKVRVSNPIATKPPVSSTPIMKEIMDTLAEVTREVKKIAETFDAELKALLISDLNLANGNS